MRPKIFSRYWKNILTENNMAYIVYINILWRENRKGFSNEE
jgi:hypothetical protein